MLHRIQNEEESKIDFIDFMGDSYLAYFINFLQLRESYSIFHYQK